MALQTNPIKIFCTGRFTTQLLAILSLLFLTVGLSINTSAQTTNFENPPFTVGSIHNQNGWSSSGSAPGSPGYDHAVVSNSTLVPAPPGLFGGQSLRISNAVTSGAFGDQTFSASIVNEAGETSAANNGMSGGTRKSVFISEFQIASAVPGAQQPGLFMSTSPDRGDGARMSYVGFEDLTDGIHVFFSEYIDAAPFGTTVAANDPIGCGAEDDFTFDDIATLNRSVPHTIKTVVTFVDGPRNDIIQIYIDGVLVKTGTSWEDYFRFCEGQPTRTVDSHLFRTGGTAAPATSGKGYLIDNLTITAPSTIVVDDDLACPNATFNTIQAAVNAAIAGDTIQVCAGTYPENVSTNKNLTFLGPQAGVDARTGRTNVSAEAVVGIAAGAFNLQVNPGTTRVDGFTMSGANTGNGDGAALLLINGSGHQIVNNIFTGNQRGAFFSSSSTTFRNNRVNNTFGGFFGGGADATVDANSFTGAYPNGAVNTTNQPQSSNYKITNNTFAATGNFAVVFNTGNGQVTGNTVTGTASTAVFIGGGNSNLLVANNSITGNGGSAVGLSGGFGYPADAGITIRSNALIGNLRGVNIATGADSTTGIEVHFNRIVGNTAFGILNGSATATVNAENNWWGCNYGPGATGPGCSGTTNGISGAVDANPWLTLRTSATPNAVMQGGTSNISSNLNTNSDNVTTSGFVPNGTPATFAATLGTVSPTSSTTTSGVTGTTFTAGAAVGTGGVQTTIDGQTVNAPITVSFTCNNVSIPTGTTTATNNQFVVPINVDNTTGRNILSYEFTLTYNPAVVTPIAVETAGTLSNGWTITTNNSSGTLTVSAFIGSPTPLTGAGVLLNLRFLATGGIATTSNLAFTSFQFNEGVPCVNTSNGNVTVISGTISGRVTYANAPTTRPVPNTAINAAGAPPRSTVTDANGLYSLSGFGPGAYTITPSKTGQVNGIGNADATAVAQHVVGFITLNATQLLAADVSGNGTVSSLDASYIAQYTAGFTPPGFTGTWRFIPVSRSYPNIQANDPDEDYSAILMGEVTGNWDPTMARPGSVKEGEELGAEELRQVAPEQVVTVTAPLSRTAAPGENFTFGLTASNTTGEGIFGYEFNLLYNQAVILPQVTPCSSAGTLSDISAGRTLICNANTPGLLRVVLFSTTGTPLSGAGDLLRLNFTVIGNVGTTSPLTLQNFIFNEGAPIDVTVDGQVVVALAPTAAAVSLGGRLLTTTGRGIANARVTITDTMGASRTVSSNPAGHYRFENVTPGQTYIVNAVSKRYTFRPLAASVVEDLTNFDLIAEQ